MTTFLTSDLHVGHRNILKYCPARGEKWKDEKEMNEGLKQLWNETVGPNDDVYLLGDIFFGKLDDAMKEYLQSLNGKKRLVLGNHDQEIRKNRRRALAIFETISDYEELILPSGTLLCMNHYAMRVWNQSHRGSFHAFGHSHGTLPPHGRSADVGIDSPWITGHIEHRPFSLDEIESFMKRQKVFLPVGD